MAHGAVVPDIAKISLRLDNIVHDAISLFLLAFLCFAAALPHCFLGISSLNRPVSVCEETLSPI